MSAYGICGLAANIGGVLAMLFMSRKFWWAPIFGVCVQLIWCTWILLGAPKALWIATLCFLATYAIAVPKWYRERTKRYRKTGPEYLKERHPK